MTERLASRLYRRVRDGVLPVGLLCFLAGFFVLHYDAFFRYAVYLLLLLPALLCLLLEDRAFFRQLYSAPMAWAVSGFFVYINLSPLWNTSPTESDPYLKHSMYILLFFYGVSVLVQASPARVWQVLRFAGVMAALSACYSFWYVGMDAGALRGGRFHAAAIDHPLLTGNVYGLFLAMWLVEQYRPDHWPRWAAAACALPVCVLVLLTQARSPLLGVAAGMLVVLLALPLRYRCMLVCAGIAAAVAAVIFWEPLLARGLSQRPEIWATVFEQAWQYPWTGHGLGSEPVFERSHSTLFDAHNVPLAVFFYGGAFGLLLWCGVLVTAAHAVWQQRHHALGLLAAVMLAYGLATTAFEAGYFINRPKENWFYLWWPLALAFGLALHARSSNQDG